MTTTLDTAIRAALERHVHEELEREIERAQQRLGDVMRKQAAQIVMSVLKSYDVAQDMNHITIRVRNEMETD